MKETAPGNSPKSTNSRQYWQRANRVIMNGTHTYGRIATQHVYPEEPLFLQRGRGSRVTDVDGNEYIDFTAGLGSIILGYNHKAVTGALHTQLEEGHFFGITHALEVEAAEQFCRLVPCAQMVRFFKSGAEGISAAVRSARAYTGRMLIVKVSYHGWHDWSIALSGRNRGIPGELAEYTALARYNSIDSFKELFLKEKHKIAGVVMEPVQFEPPGEHFLQEVRDLCSEHKTLLIFDEILTGGRFPGGSAQAYFKITPDLAVFSKAIANGMPLAVLGGPEEILAEAARSVFISSTFSGELLSLAGLRVILSLLEQDRIIPELWARGIRIKSIFNQAFEQEGLAPYLGLEGYPSRLQFVCPGPDQALSARLLGRLILSARAQGILINPKIFPILDHSEEDLARLEAAAGIMAGELGQLVRTTDPAPGLPAYRNRFM